MLHWQAWEKGVKSLYYCRSKSVQRAAFAGSEDKAELTEMEKSMAEAAPTDYEECLFLRCIAWGYITDLRDESGVEKNTYRGTENAKKTQFCCGFCVGPVCCIIPSYSISPR